MTGQSESEPITILTRGDVVMMTPFDEGDDPD
jgi:hypothetical protein